VSFEGFRVQFESFDPDTGVVHVTSAVGSFSAVWADDREPKPGDWSYIEFDTDPTCVWGVDVVEVSPDEPDRITEDAEGWWFVGKILGIEPDSDSYFDGGRFISEVDLEDGIFTLRLGPHMSGLLAAEGLPRDAAGRHVRVRQTRVHLYPQ
jgi:hypothetical protein